MHLIFCCGKSGINSNNSWTQAAFWLGHGVGKVFLEYIRLLNTNQASFICCRLPLYCCWACPCLNGHKFSHLIKATSSMIIHLVSRLRLFLESRWIPLCISMAFLINSTASHLAFWQGKLITLIAINSRLLLGVLIHNISIICNFTEFDKRKILTGLYHIPTA